MMGFKKVVGEDTNNGYSGSVSNENNSFKSKK